MRMQKKCSFFAGKFIFGGSIIITTKVIFSADKLKITICQDFGSYEGFNFGGIPKVTRTFPVGAPKIIKELTQDELEQYFNDYAQSTDEKILKDALRLKKKVQKIFKIK